MMLVIAAHLGMLSQMQLEGCRLRRGQFLDGREEKSRHNHHRKKIFWRTFLASKKNFPGRWWIQKPYKNQKNHIHHRNISSVDPIFSAKKSSALEQGGVCFLFPSTVKHFRSRVRNKSGKTPETLLEQILNFQASYGWRFTKSWKRQQIPSPD